MDVGDAVELTFRTTPAATVTVTWSSPGREVVYEVPVPETGEPGRYTATLVGTYAGLWQAVFHASGVTSQHETYYVRYRPTGGPPPLATVGEYVELFGALSLPREALVRALLRRASQLVRDTHPGLEAKIAGGRVSADSVGLAVLNMVVRVMRNPNGLRAETTGPFSRSYDPDLASGLLTLTDADTALLAGSRPPRRRAAAGTIWVRPGLEYGHVRRW